MKLLQTLTGHFYDSPFRLMIVLLGFDRTILMRFKPLTGHSENLVYSYTLPIRIWHYICK